MFKKIKSIGGMFKKSLKGMVDKDIETLENDGAIRLYNRIKFMFGSMWNSIMDRIIHILLKSAMIDADEIVKRCLETGENPMDFLPDNLTMRFTKKYF